MKTVVILILSVLLAGCKGTPTKGEKEARRQVQAVAGTYRPEGRKPELPVLTSQSSLSNYLTYALLNQPQVEAAYFDWLASVERITTVRSLPDPQFTFQMDIQNVVTSIMPGLMARFPWLGKLRVAAEAASAESQSKYFTFQSAVLNSAFAVKRAYYQLYFLAEKIRVNQETLQLLGELEQLARAQNEVGKVTLQDVLRAQIEEDRLRTQIANLEDSRSPLMAQFKAALGLKADDPAPPMPQRFESTPLDLSADKLLATALAQNTRLKAMEAEVRAAEAAIALARQSRLPDFSLGFMADVKMNPTLYRLPGGPGAVSLPIWRDKIAAQIAEAQANKRSAEARLSTEQIALAVDFADRTYRYREATRNLALLNDLLLPKARQSLEVARSGYLGGQIDFFNLTDAERTLLGFDLDRVEATTQREITLAELSLIIAGMPPSSSSAVPGAAGMAGSSPSAANEHYRRHVNQSSIMKLNVPSGKLSVLLALTFWVAASAGLLLTGCGEARSPGAGESANKTLYTCGMDPQVIQDKPGNCPICGMTLRPVRKQFATEAGAPGSSTNVSAGERKVLYYKSSMNPGETSPVPAKDSMGMDMVPVYASAAAGPAAAGLISIDPVTMQDMDLRTASVTKGPLRRTVRTVGVIDYDERALAEVTTKFKGWIEKLYVDTTGQLVMRGEPLFEIYSPELYTAQREYLLAIEQGTNTPGTLALRTSALTKLKFYDISGEQIGQLERTRQPTKTLRILAPQDGFVIEKSVVEGQMVDPGMKIYRLADLGLVWVQAQIYEQDLDYLKLGQEATMTLSYLPDREFRGRVTYIYPNVDEKTRTARVRVEFHNPGYFLKPGMFATVEVTSELEPSALLIPDMAILRSGEKNTVFVALEGGKFEPRTVTLGPQAEHDTYQVLSGLREGERIVTSGQFLLDSESQLREAILKMQEPKKAGAPARPAGLEAPGAAATNLQGAVAGAAVTETNIVKYICPMPEHVSIEYDHPGKCPICGMTLVPVSTATLRKLQPGGKLLYYTCPMPEHSDVHESKPGKCPKCGMTLIPVMEAPPLPKPAAPTEPGGETMPQGMAMPEPPR